MAQQKNLIPSLFGGESRSRRRSLACATIAQAKDLRLPIGAHSIIELNSLATWKSIPLTAVRGGRVVATILAIILLATTANQLTAQVADQRRTESSRSYIVRLTPGAEPKVVMEQAQVLLSGEGTVNSRAVIPWSHSSRSLASASPLTRYFVFDVRVVDHTSFQYTLQNLSAVESVFPNHVWTIDRAVPNDSLYPEQWALEKIQALDAWDVTEGSPDVLVGILDTGIEWEHPDLRGAFWINPAEDINNNGQFDPWPFDEVRDGVTGDFDGIDQDGNGFPDDVIGYDFVDQDVPNIGDWSGWDPMPEDDQGHGTTVTGVIAARKNNQIGVAGIAPGVRIVALRAFDGTGNAQDDDVAAAIVYAADNGVKVLNMSFGDFYRSPLMYDAIRYAADKGVVLVGSSGNDGVSDPHYPSGFSEVMSVGATTDQDFLSPFSTFGSQLSMTAPGTNIYTTAIDAGYSSVNGTSFAAPYVAGVAALLCSVHPDWTADEIVAALELSSDDLGEPAWDPNFGAGRLNAAAALKGSGPAIIAITSPLSDEGVDADAEVPVYGSAIAPLLESWTLEVGVGSLPQDWTTISSSDKGVLDGLLGTLNTASFPDALLTLRLNVTLTNGRTVERRTQFFLDRTPPDTTEFNLRNVWRFSQRALAITLRTDDLTRATVWVRPAGNPTSPFRPFELEAEFVGLTHAHFFFLTSLELTPGLPYDLYVELVNAAGGRTLIGTPNNPLPAQIEQEAFPVTRMLATGWTLPYGFVLDERLSLTVSDSSEILINQFEDFAFDHLALFRFDDGEFTQVDSGANWIPRSVGDSDGDGLLEVLGQSSQEGIVFEQSVPGGSPFATVMFSDTATKRFFPSTFYDFNGDGRDELVGYTSESDAEEQYYFVAAWDGQRYVEQIRLPNVTLPRLGFNQNFMGASDVVIGDFNRNGKVNMLFGDADADFMLYERESSTSWKVLWVDENTGDEGDRMIAAGDLDNDGIDELVVAYATLPLQLNSDREHPPALWTVKVVKPGNSGGVEVLAVEEFAYVRPSSPFRAGLQVGDLDGKPGAEIALSVFPNMYVLQLDSAKRKLQPFWWRGASLLNRPIIQDFNQDGVAELGVGDGEEIVFYQIDPERNSPDPPAGAQGWSLNDSTAYIEWEPVSGAERYHVYRALLPEDGGPVSYSRILSLTETSLVDTGLLTDSDRLEEGKTYGYIVTAEDDDVVDTESSGTGVVQIFMHPQAQLTNAEAVNGRELRVDFSQPVRQALYRNGALYVEHLGLPVPLSSVQPVGERTVLLALLDNQYGAELQVQATSLFRDRFNSPVDTTIRLTVTMPEEVVEPLFVAVRATPLENKSIGIDFNENVDPTTGVNPVHYTLDPPGIVSSISIDPNSPDRVILKVDDNYPFGPFGYEYLVTIRDVQSESGKPINKGAGSVVGFTISADQLNDLFVYPHPFSISRDGSVTFAGLPKGVLIRVYTASGSLLREIEGNQGDGGVAWDGTDAQGRVVPSGVYLYSVVVLSADGEEVESRLRKIAVLP